MVEQKSSVIALEEGDVGDDQLVGRPTNIGLHLLLTIGYMAPPPSTEYSTGAATPV